MKRIILLLSVAVFLVPCLDSDAQSLRSMMRKKIIEDNLKAQAKRDSIRAVEEGKEPDKSPNTTMTHVYMDAFGLSDNVDYESTYEFDAYIQLEVSNYDKKEKLDDKMVYDSYVNKESIDYAMKFGEDDARTTVVFDEDNSVMLMLTDSDGEKTGFAMGVDKEAMARKIEETAEESDETETYRPKKTGRTKTIQGYTCEEYLLDNEDEKVHMWVSKKLADEVRKSMLYNKQYFGGTFHHAAYVDGMVMEYDYTDKEDENRVVMQVTGIDLNRDHTISTREYAVMTMSQEQMEDFSEEDKDQ